MSIPQVCVPKILTPEEASRAAEFAILENPLNRPWGATPRQMAVEVGKRWANGKTLRVRFLNGSDVQKMKCEREAHKWETFANIKFAFDNSPDAEIRVSFYDGKRFFDQGSWAFVGTDALITPKDRETVNFGWLADTTDDKEWERVVCHEFGHVLGADHEDQQPASNIKWNRDYVYKYFESPPNNWTKAMVDANVLNPTGEAGIFHTDFDEHSIMAYFVPPEFTMDGKGIPGGFVISGKDGDFMGRMYPFDIPIRNPELVPDTIPVNAVLDAFHPTNTFDMSITSFGNYGIWTSLPSGVVSVFKGDDLIGRELQQVNLPLAAGRYRITVTPTNPSMQVNYRISAKRTE